MKDCKRVECMGSNSCIDLCWKKEPKQEQGEPVAWKPDRSGKYLTIVYKDVIPGDEVGALHEHPKCVAMSWSNALQDVDYLKQHQHPQPKQEQGEPVAWMMHNSSGDEISITESNLRHHQPAFVQDLWKDSTPLYTTPQQRKPLTDEQITALEYATDTLDFPQTVRAIEAAHGIRPSDFKE